MGNLLGVTINEKLSWNNHIDETIKAVNGRVSLIKRLKEVMNKEDLKTIGECLVNSKIRYGIAIYGDVQSKESDRKNCQIQRLQKVQNSLMRIILGKKRSEHISIASLLKNTGYLSVNQMAVYHSLGEMFSIIRHRSVPEVSDEVNKKLNESYNTRQTENGTIFVPRVKKKKNEGFTVKTAKLWNSLPEDIRLTEKKSIFNNKLKEWIVSNIPI